MNTVTYSELGLPQRSHPRPVELQQENYLELYDSNTLFYDVFIKNNKLIFLGPPIDENIVDEIILNIFIDEISLVKHRYKLYKSNKVYKLIVDIKALSKVRVFGRQLDNFTTELDGFNRNKILFTVQKNNDVEWIKY